MKRHINTTHKAVPVVKKRKRGCHSSPKPAPLKESSQSCDICGRIVRGNPLALLSHKFTHKNDEERAAALAAGEPGSRACFLSKKPHCGKRMKMLMDNKKPSTDQESDWKGDLTCLFCLRTFERKNYLKLHLRTHQDQVQPRERQGAPILKQKFKKGSQDEFCGALGLARNVKKGNGDGRGSGVGAGTSKGGHSR
ncbi:Insulinoma-associated protein 1 [Orchesella cincta]|uniref:Insulinoma-associated protein 1 n=1 Tax=Orchesella cincta TaxID=48709 RepID=A0A1D2M9L9_ORCCI|nr:Insulinoma-associated protein 1 [Orchesella cincta]